MSWGSAGDAQFRVLENKLEHHPRGTTSQRLPLPCIASIWAFHPHMVQEGIVKEQETPLLPVALVGPQGA
jgi:hypothetical protein